MKPLTTGWDLGLAFSSLPGDLTASMADFVFAPNTPPVFGSRNCSYDTVMARVPEGDGGVAASQVCTRVDVGYDGGITNKVRGASAWPRSWQRVDRLASDATKTC